VVTIVISFFTKKREESELVGLVKGMTEEAEGAEVPFIKKPEFVAIISAVVLIIVNILFW
jgi:SSS family solute:Na+ symporter